MAETQLTLEDIMRKRPIHKFFLETNGQTYEFSRILDRQWFIKTNHIERGRCWFTTNGQYIDGYDFAPSPITGA